MSCTSPVIAYQPRKKNRNGTTPLKFKEPSRLWNYIKITVSCCGCIGCRKRHTSEWAMRIMHEASQSEFNEFVTFTYRNEDLPRGGTLVKAHFTLFMKRLRDRFPEQKIRYIQCGEYGEKTDRPHHHAIIFNLQLPDKKLYSEGQNPLYTSKILDELWSHGECKTGTVTTASAQYVASYVFKKINGKLAETHYERIDPTTGEIYKIQPPYVTMSNRPGIGSKWYDQWAKTDVHPHDECVIDGHQTPVPKYYDKKLRVIDPDRYDEIKLQRKAQALLDQRTHKQNKYQEKFNAVMQKQKHRNQI